MGKVWTLHILYKDSTKIEIETLLETNADYKSLSTQKFFDLNQLATDIPKAFRITLLRGSPGHRKRLVSIPVTFLCDWLGIPSLYWKEASKKLVPEMMFRTFRFPVKHTVDNREIQPTIL